MTVVFLDHQRSATMLLAKIMPMIALMFSSLQLNAQTTAGFDSKTCFSASSLDSEVSNSDNPFGFKQLLSPEGMSPSPVSDAAAIKASSKCLAIIGSLVDWQQLFDSGSGVGNGGGMVEAYFANALIQMEELIERTLKTSTQLDERDHTLLRKIANSMPKELSVRPLIVITRRNASFTIDGQPKIAYTGSAVGSKIFVDQDSLYINSGKNILLPAISYQMAIQVVLHELGHHHGESDHDYLAELGAKVALQSSERNSETLKNSSFEKTTASGIPADWNIGWQNKSYLYTDRMVFARGKSALVMGSQFYDGYGYVYQCLSIAGKKSKGLKVSALLMPYMMTPQSRGGVSVQIYNNKGQVESYFDGYNYVSFGMSSFYPAFVAGQAAWQFLSVGFVLGSQSQTACVSFYSAGLGQLWVDDVQLDLF